MKTVLMAAAIVVIGLALGAEAQQFADSPVISKFGDWSVIKTKDSMTDDVRCLAIYKDDRRGPQLADSGFWMAMRGNGGLKAYQYRLDDQRVVDGRLAGWQSPSTREREMSVININAGTPYFNLLKAKRVRLNVLTVLDTAVDFDISLDGASEAYAVIMSAKCK